MRRREEKKGREWKRGSGGSDWNGNERRDQVRLDGERRGPADVIEDPDDEKGRGWNVEVFS